MDPERLPAWVTWQHRPFPDANLLLLRGRQPTLVDSGFVGHAQQTAAWLRAHTGHIALVINTHWHADHVGGNGPLHDSFRAVGFAGQLIEVIPHLDLVVVITSDADQGRDNAADLVGAVIVSAVSASRP